MAKIYLFFLLFFLMASPLEGSENLSRERLLRLVRHLGHPSYRMRELNTQTLIALGPSVLEALRELEKKENSPEVRWRLRYCIDEIKLQKMGPYSLIRWLIQKAQKAPKPLSSPPLEELLGLGKRAVQPLLEMVLNPREDPEEKQIALAVLKKFPRKDLLPHFSQALIKADRNLAYDFMGLLFTLSPQKGKQILWEMIQSPSKETKLRALFLLSFHREIKEEKWKAPFFTLSKSPKEEVRLFALRCLGRFQDRESLNRLEKALGDSSLRVRVSALIELTLHPSPESKKIFLDLLENSNPFFVKSALEGLARIGAREELSRIRPFLKSPHLPVRQAAIYALGELGDSSSLPHLLGLLDQNKISLKLQALQTLGLLRAPEGLSPILKLSRDGHPLLRKTAFQALGNYSSKEALKRMIQGLDDRDSLVVDEAVLALRKATNRYFGYSEKASPTKKKKLWLDGRNGGRTMRGRNECF